MTIALPIAPTRTAFCHAEVPLDLWREDGTQLAFFIDGNSKITAGNGLYEVPRPNALSLPAASVDPGTACPGSTSICRSSCYVRGLAKHAPDLYARYAENLRVFEELTDLGPRYLTHAANVLAVWIATECQGGFRWHVSGDVVSPDHAQWITEVAYASPGVQHWIYTRTLDAVGYLVGEPNLAVNISADAENLEKARAVADLYNVRLCYLSHDGQVPELPDGSVIFPDYPLRGREMPSPTDHVWWQSLTQRERAMVCPTDFFGQSEAHRCGPCRKCM